jgi:hypothetical protein
MDADEDADACGWVGGHVWIDVHMSRHCMYGVDMRGKMDMHVYMYFPMVWKEVLVSTFMMHGRVHACMYA